MINQAGWPKDMSGEGFSVPPDEINDGSPLAVLQIPAGARRRPTQVRHDGRSLHSQRNTPQSLPEIMNGSNATYLLPCSDIMSGELSIPSIQSP